MTTKTILILILIMSALLLSGCNDTSEVININCHSYCSNNQTQVNEFNAYMKISIETQNTYCGISKECK